MYIEVFRFLGKDLFITVVFLIFSLFLLCMGCYVLDCVLVSGSWPWVYIYYVHNINKWFECLRVFKCEFAKEKKVHEGLLCIQINPNLFIVHLVPRIFLLLFCREHR